MFDLNKKYFKDMQHIVYKQWDNIEINAVLNGINQGWVFVNEQINPKTALLWSRGIEGFYFIGEPDNDQFNQNACDFVMNILDKRIRQSGLNYFEFSGDRPEWDSILEQIFDKQELIKSRQCVYKFDLECWKDHEMRSDQKGVNVYRIDKSFFENKIENFSFVENEILRWWNSLEHFFEHAFGYCVVCDEIIVSYCLTNFVYGNTYTLGIETLKDYRRKGYCQIAVEAFITDLLEHDSVPYWDCMYTKVASRKLAEKIGFYLDHTYALYRILLSEEE